MEPQQPVPQVSTADVARVVAREYDASDRQRVLDILRQYVGDTDDGAARVQLAALKLAAGDAVQLQEHIRQAVMDFRDVLLAAEYPGAGAIGWSAFDRLSAEDQQLVYDADWEQYQRWLRES